MDNAATNHGVVLSISNMPFNLGIDNATFCDASTF